MIGPIAILESRFIASSSQYRELNWRNNANLCEKGDKLIHEKV